MAILADGELRALMRDGGLVEGGALERASECSYSFVPGAAFVPGSLDPPIVFPGEDGKAEVVVKPGRMIWIRTLERVKVPRTLVGFWWQTNTLSRRGLMLVNMSMVEPGYEGDLACLFVNFGKSNIAIAADTVVAKMVFAELTGELLHPFPGGASRDSYDRKLRDLVIDQPASFLQVGDMMVDLKDARAEALDEIRFAVVDGKAEAAHSIGQLRADAAHSVASARADAEKAVADAQAGAARALTAAGSDELTKFKTNIPTAVRSSFLWAAGALALLTVASVASDWIKGHLFPDTKEIARSAAEDALGNRLSISAGPLPPEAARLRGEIDALNRRIVLLERRK